MAPYVYENDAFVSVCVYFHDLMLTQNMYSHNYTHAYVHTYIHICTYLATSSIYMKISSHVCLYV